MNEIVTIARCPKHGLHGERSECFECGGPVEQVPMVPCDGTAVFVASGVQPDAVRAWYEVPEQVAETVRRHIDPEEMFVECLLRLCLEREGTYRQVLAENKRLKRQLREETA